MTPTVLAIVAGALATIAAVLAILFKIQAAEAKAAAATHADERDAVKEELSGLKAKVERREKEQAKRNEEMTDLRRKLDKLKKRTKQHQHGEDEVPEQIRQIEKELAKEKASAADAKGQLHQARVGVATLQSELDVFKTGENVDRQAAETTELKNSIKHLEEQARDADERAAKATEEAAAAKKSAAKHKGKNEVLDKTYLVLRGEHELKKDEARKLRAEVERLLALRVGITEDTVNVPPEVAPQPSVPEPEDASETEPEA